MEAGILQDVEKHTCPGCGVASRWLRYPELLVHNASFSIGGLHAEPYQVFDLCYCAACSGPILRHYVLKIDATAHASPPPGGRFENGKFLYQKTWGYGNVVFPTSKSRLAAPAGIPEEIAREYNEAANVLAYSPKAAAALARRLLEHVLETTGGAGTNGALIKKIDRVVPNLPPYIAEGLHRLREIGNFAAHPRKDTNSGEVLPVEPEEAEYTVRLLGGLLEHYFVRPAVEARMRDALNEKLLRVGKPPLS
jgi:hypothetical protein